METRVIEALASWTHIQSDVDSVIGNPPRTVAIVADLGTAHHI
jgi:hypothetical protein